MKRLQYLSIALTTTAALAMFCWPLYAGELGVTETGLAQAAFIVLMPLLLTLVLVEFSAEGMDSRRLALLGVLAALNAVVRMLGLGTAGIETVFFLIVIAGAVFGSRFGFILGALSILVSAVLTAGVGPWLPFQAMAAGLVGLGAGSFRRLLPKAARAWLMGYAFIASFVYGGLMTMWNWPFMAGTGTTISYLPGAGPIANFERFVYYELFTGGLLWDLGRAVTTCILIWLTAPALIATLNRAATRAGLSLPTKRGQQ